MAAPVRNILYITSYALDGCRYRSNHKLECSRMYAYGFQKLSRQKLVIRPASLDFAKEPPIESSFRVFLWQFFIDFRILFRNNMRMEFMLSNELMQTSRARGDIHILLITRSSLNLIQCKESNITAKGNTIQNFDRSLMIPSTHIYYFHMSSGEAHSIFWVS
jgi:hypothetical protein